MSILLFLLNKCSLAGQWPTS